MTINWPHAWLPALYEVCKEWIFFLWLNLLSAALNEQNFKANSANHATLAKRGKPCKEKKNKIKRDIVARCLLVYVLARERAHEK